MNQSPGNMERTILYRPERPALTVEGLQTELRSLSRLLNTTQLKGGERVKILFLDFDGPLAIPWTINEDHWGHIPSLIRETAEKQEISLCLVSFNPDAEDAITRWGIRDCFIAVRSGSNHPRSKGEEYTEAHRKDLSKPNQIRSIFERELQGRQFAAAFFDDDSKNLLEVHQEFDGLIKCFHINSDEGLSAEILSRLL